MSINHGGKDKVAAVPLYYIIRKEMLAVFGHENKFRVMSENGQRIRKNQAYFDLEKILMDLEITLTQMKMTYFFKTLKSPLGALKLVASDDALVAILWENDEPTRVPLGPLTAAPEHPILVETERQLLAYFAGKLEKFDLQLAFAGTAFQQEVWTALLTIPFGETRSYADIARQIGRPSAVRAVGAANGRNPISIVAPCHRVIGSNGKLTGFAGGLNAKAFLINLEAKHELLRVA